MKKSLVDKDLVFLDTETTGLNPWEHEILEIAVIRGSTQKVWKIKPRNPAMMSPDAIKVNGYTPEAWSAAVWFEDMVDELTAILEDSIWVGHNISFDKYFIGEAYRRAGKFQVFESMGHHTLDTATLAYEHLAPEGLKGLSLAKICTWLDISNQGAHNALIDAQRCREVFFKLNRRTI